MLVQMRGITKSFPGILANDAVDFDLAPGEVHALLGENGAGKSTLMSVLTGLYTPDAGSLRIAGRPVQFTSPRDAIAAGIGMVHQHFKLVQSFTVAENIILGLKHPRFRLNLKDVQTQVKTISERFGLKVEPAARIWQLSVGEQQRVEIVKVLYRGARILIMDEPTAVLTPQEADELFQTLRAVAAQGNGVVLITHKLHEVMAVADRITVLRDGKHVATLGRAETNSGDLARLMVGRDIALDVTRVPGRPGGVALNIDNLTAEGDRGTPALRGVSLQVRAGEILGIAGVAGNGQRELSEAISGLRKVSSGRVRVGDQDITGRSPIAVMRAGLRFIPEDRHGMGLVPNLNLPDNVILKEFRDPPIARGPLLNQKAARERCRELVQRFDVRTAGIDIPVKLLSGGNAQKLLLARELAADPRVVVAVDPVRGLDVGATKAVHQILLEQRQAGKAILLISSDLDELLTLSDRIAVIFEGRIMGERPADPQHLNAIGLMMAGQAAQEVTA